MRKFSLSRHESELNLAEMTVNSRLTKRFSKRCDDDQQRRWRDNKCENEFEYSDSSLVAVERFSWVKSVKKEKQKGRGEIVSTNFISLNGSDGGSRMTWVESSRSGVSRIVLLTHYLSPDGKWEVADDAVLYVTSQLVLVWSWWYADEWIFCWDRL